MRKYIQPTMSQFVVSLDSMLASSPNGEFLERPDGNGGYVGVDPSTESGEGAYEGEFDAKERGGNDFGSLW